MQTPRGPTTGIGQSPSSGHTAGNVEQWEKAGHSCAPATLSLKVFKWGGKKGKPFYKIISSDVLLLHFCRFKNKPRRVPGLLTLPLGSPTPVGLTQVESATLVLGHHA